MRDVWRVFWVFIESLNFLYGQEEAGLLSTFVSWNWNHLFRIPAINPRQKMVQKLSTIWMFSMTVILKRVTWYQIIIVISRFRMMKINWMVNFYCQLNVTHSILLHLKRQVCSLIYFIKDERVVRYVGIEVVFWFIATV